MREDFILTTLFIFEKSQLDALVAHVAPLKDPHVFEQECANDYPDYSHAQFLEDLDYEWQPSDDFTHLAWGWICKYHSYQYSLNFSLWYLFTFLHCTKGPSMPVFSGMLSSTDMTALKQEFMAGETAQALPEAQRRDWWNYFLLAGMKVSVRRDVLEHPALRYLTANHDCCYGYFTKSQVEALLPTTDPDSFPTFVRQVMAKEFPQATFWSDYLQEWATILEKIKNLGLDEYYVLDIED